MMMNTPSPTPQHENQLLSRESLRPKTTYLVEQRTAKPAHTGSLLPFLWRTLIFLSIILVLRFVAPVVIEEIQYGITRGRQRAEYETSGEALKNLELARLSTAYQMVTQRVGPSVVHIEVEFGDDDATLSEEGHSIFGRPRGLPRHPLDRGQGSGVIVDADGYLLTNLHVIHGASEIFVTLSDGRRVSASIVGLDDLTDLAVLKVNARQLIPATWGNSDELHEGALVWAMGSPFGLKRSVTSGIVSAKNRAGMAGTPYQDFLQTDAAVNPGNSGGPLVDVSGKVVGINTMIVGATYQGISFAVPSTVAKKVYDSHIAYMQSQGLL